MIGVIEKKQLSKWMVKDGHPVHNLDIHDGFKYILIINYYCSTYNTSDTIFPIGIRSQSSCAILFIWKRNKWDITILLTYSAWVIWSVTCVCVCENRLGHLGSIHYKAWIFLFTSAPRLDVGLTQRPIQWQYFSRHTSATAFNRPFTSILCRGSTCHKTLPPHSTHLYGDDALAFEKLHLYFYCQ